MLLYVGPDGSKLCGELNGLPVRDDGYLPANEASIRFAAMDIYLAPYIDGISTRRTSLMSGLQHGVPTVGTRGMLTDEMLAAQDGRAFLLADVNEPAAFDSHVVRLLNDDGLRASLGAEGTAFYEREFSWPRIVERLLTDLKPRPSHVATTHFEAA